MPRIALSLRKLPNRLLTAALPLLVLAASGCGPTFEYLVGLGLGEAQVLLGSVPIDQILSDPQADPAIQGKLLWLQQVRQFAQQEIGLTLAGNYQKFYDTDQGPAVYNLSASLKDALKALSWDFPIVGTIQYLGFFQLESARQLAQQLEQLGRDTIIYGAIAYSTGGKLPDPVYSSMLQLDNLSLAETVIHELTHNTVYKYGDSEFNESIANFVGRQGALEMTRDLHGLESDIYLQATQRLEDQHLVDQFMADLHEQLKAFYAREDLTSRQKILDRDQIFDAARLEYQQQIAPALQNPQHFAYLAQVPINNAWVLLYYRYNKGLDLFERVYQASGEDLAAAVVVFQQAGQAQDAYEYLEQWLGQAKSNN